MFVMQGLVLKLEVLEFLVLVACVAFEELGEVIDSFANFLIELLEFCLGTFFQFLELELQLALLLSLPIQRLLEMFDCGLGYHLSYLNVVHLLLYRRRETQFGIVAPREAHHQIVQVRISLHHIPISFIANTDKKQTLIPKLQSTNIAKLIAISKLLIRKQEDWVYNLIQMGLLDAFRKKNGVVGGDYDFHVEHTPTNNVTSSSLIAVVAYDSKQKKASIPCIFKWSTIRHSVVTEVAVLNGDSYMCEACDVGAEIQVDITSCEPEHPGTATVVFGPVSLDPAMKQDLYKYLTVGQAKFSIDLLNRGQIKECEMVVQQKFMKIFHFNSKRQFTFLYSMAEPRITFDPRDPTNLEIYFGQKYQKEATEFILQLCPPKDLKDLADSSSSLKQQRMSLRFVSKRAKDTFLLIIKAFNTKGYLKTSAVLHKIERIDFHPDTINYIYEIEALKSDLLKLIEANQKLTVDKKRYYDEAKDLDREIGKIIESYTAIIEGNFNSEKELDQSLNHLNRKKKQYLNRKMQQLGQENELLREKVSVLSDQLNKFEGLAGSSERQGVMRSNGFGEILNNLNISGIEKKEDKNNEEWVKGVKELDTIHRKPIFQTTPHNQEDLSLLYSEPNRTKMTILKDQIPEKHKINESAIEKRLENVVLSKQTMKKEYIRVIRENCKLRGEINQTRRSEGWELLAATKKLKNSNVKPSQQKLQEPKGVYKKEMVETLEKRLGELLVENQSLCQTNERLSNELEKEELEKEEMRRKYKRKIENLQQELLSAKRSNDIMDRSQNISQELEQHNEEQIKSLKQSNQQLFNENQRLLLLCEKYAKNLKRVNESPKINRSGNLFSQFHQETMQNQGIKNQNQPINCQNEKNEVSPKKINQKENQLKKEKSQQSRIREFEDKVKEEASNLLNQVQSQIPQKVIKQSEIAADKVKEKTDVLKSQIPEKVIQTADKVKEKADVLKSQIPQKVIEQSEVTADKMKKLATELTDAI